MDLKSVPLVLSTPFMSQIDGSSFLSVPAFTLHEQLSQLGDLL